ncbi:hypothetical protein L9F63_010392, partial [Diploptera punctata]
MHIDLNKNSNTFIKILFSISKILNLFPLRITKNRCGYVFNEISKSRLAFCIVFHVILNIYYVYRIFGTLPAYLHVIQFSGFLFLIIYSLCHIVAVITCMKHSKIIYGLMYNINCFKIVSAVNAKELCKEAKLFIVTSFLMSYCILHQLLNSWDNFNTYTISFSWIAVNLITYIATMHFVIIISILKVILMKINTKFSQIQTKNSNAFNEIFKSNDEHKSYRSTGNKKSKITELKLLSKNYLNICNTSAEICDIYSILMLVFAVKIFIVVTFQSFVTVLNIKNKNTVLYYFMWALTELMQFCTLLYSCCSFTKEVS